MIYWVTILMFSSFLPREKIVTSPKIDEAHVIVLDISKSMETDDLLPTRIEFAKKLITENIPKLSHIGIIIFAGKTFVLSPITEDLRGCSSLVSSLVTDTINQGEAETSGTNIWDALIQASTLFSSGTTKKQIILITDGRANIWLDPIVAAEELKNNNISTSIIALGSTSDISLNQLIDGKRVPLLDDSGNTINGSVDLTSLSQIADITGGKLIHLAKDTDSFDSGIIFNSKTPEKKAKRSPLLDSHRIVLLLWFLGIFHLILSFVFWHRYKTP